VQKWDPDYWFLSERDKFQFVLREKGYETDIPVNQLLSERFDGWYSGNSSTASPWLMPQPEEHLCKAYTANNDVTPLIHGKTFMKDLYAKLTSLKSGDFVLMAGWEFTLSRYLDDPDVLASYLPKVLADLRAKGIEARLIAFKNPLPSIKNNQLVDSLNSLYAAEDGPLIRVAYLDGETGGFAMSHHQKEVFVGSSAYEKSCAYVGGMDLAVDRWDDEQHARGAPEKRFFGWHDVQVKVQGDALTQIWANFAERWGSVNRRISTVRTKLQEFRLKPCPVPAWKPTSPGTQYVQVLRTVATAPSSDPARFMSLGERTVLCALKKAIEKAECYIYIEEQFLWDCEIADFIRARMVENDALRLIVVMAAESEFPGNLKGYAFHLRSLFFMKVMRVASKAEIAFGARTRVYAYGLYQTPAHGGKPIYVHSKLIIIDDRYVSVGSANVDARSMHIETELNLGIVDAATEDIKLNGQTTTVCTFAKNLRETLWKEHLNLPTLPSDPIEALKKFPQGFATRVGVKMSWAWPTNEMEAKILTKHHVRCYVNKPGSYHASTPAAQRLLDRNQRRWRPSAVGG
jgi:phosphatidylserine/phosphatidylglycerophosphate/cardiolipin synthase-like enzyme